MNKIFYILAGVWALSACTKAPPSEVLVFKDEALSSPNQPIYRFALHPSSTPQSLYVLTKDSAGHQWGFGNVNTDDFGNIIRLENGLWLPFTLGCPHFGPGEGLDVYFINRDATYKTHIVPHPLRIEQYGYALSLEKMDRLAYGWRVRGGGFDPGEEVWIITFAGPRITTDYVRTASDGTLTVNVDAWQEGKYSGATKMEFHAGRGTLYLDFPWGDDWYAWRKKEVAERQKLDQQYRHDLKWTSDYQGYKQIQN